MPKSTILLPNRRTVSKRVKFKIGGRKSTASALDMSDSDLIDLVNDKNSGRRRQIASTVLNKRGVKVHLSKETV